jgi:hypothetical protein
MVALIILQPEMVLKVLRGHISGGEYGFMRPSRRKPSYSLVRRSMQRATPMILRAVEQVHQRAVQTHSSADRRQTDAPRGSMWLG